MAKRKMPEKIVDAPEVIVEETIIVEPTTAPEPKTVIGIVNGCARLNIRKEPSMHATARIATVVASGSELTINLAKSTEDWYRVITESGIEGFCMKKFVTVK